MATKRLKRPRDPIQLGKLIVDTPPAKSRIEWRMENQLLLSKEGRPAASKVGWRARKNLRHQKESQLHRQPLAPGGNSSRMLNS
jgi:hypothetical protein